MDLKFKDTIKFTAMHGWTSESSANEEMIWWYIVLLKIVNAQGK